MPLNGTLINNAKIAPTIVYKKESKRVYMKKWGSYGNKDKTIFACNSYWCEPVCAKYKVL